MRRVLALRGKNAHAAMRQGKALRTTFFGVRFLPHPTDNLLVGVVVGKKVTRGAVARNKIRRRVREYVRRRAQQKETRAGTAVIFPQQEAVSLSRKEFYQELEKALGKAGVLIS